MIRTTLLTLAVCATSTVALAQPIPAATYVAKAGASDLFERQSGKLMTTSQNQDVRNFATMMIQHHTQSTADVKAAAKAAHLSPAPPRLSAAQARDLAALGRIRGEKRDRLYVDQQKAAHADALALQQGYATEGRVAPLRKAAGKIVPVVQQHIQMLARM